MTIQTHAMIHIPESDGNAVVYVGLWKIELFPQEEIAVDAGNTKYPTNDHEI